MPQTFAKWSNPSTPKATSLAAPPFAISTFASNSATSTLQRWSSRECTTPPPLQPTAVSWRTTFPARGMSNSMPRISPTSKMPIALRKKSAASSIPSEFHGPSLTPLLLPFHNRNVSIHGKTGKTLRRATRQRPFDFEPVHLLALAYSQHYSWIVRGQIAPAPHLHPAPLQIPRLIGQSRANGIRIRSLADQLNAQPIVPPAGVVAKEHWSAIVDGD